MNLVPFEFAGWLLLIVAFFLMVFSMTPRVRPLLAGCAGLSLVAAAGFYNVRGDQLSRHSPVTVLEGQVADVGHIHNKGSSYETIQLRFDDGQLSPVFDTRGLGIGEGRPAIGKGDRMRASFYDWAYTGYEWTYSGQESSVQEREPFAMRVLSGRAGGWWYQEPPRGWELTWVTAVVALVFYGLILLRSYRGIGTKRA